MLPLRRSAALTVILVLAACNPVGVAESAAPTVSATPTPTQTSSPSATPSMPSPEPTQSAVEALVHCTGAPSSGVGRSVHRSSTWSGYVAAQPPGRFSCVEAAWLEPEVACGAADAAVGMWVGIGGYSSNDLQIFDDDHAMERAGTGVDCEDGEAEHYAWHQVGPREASDQPFVASEGQSDEMAIEAGDRIWAQVRYGAGAYVMTVANLSSGDVRSSFVADSGAQRSSAEWVVGGEEGEPLARFSSAAFTGGLCTMDGILGSVGSAAWLRNQIDEWAGGVKRLRVGDLAADGSSFGVTWLHR